MSPKEKPYSSISSIVTSCQKWHHFPMMMMEMQSVYSQVINKKIMNLLGQLQGKNMGEKKECQSLGKCFEKIGL